MLLRIVWAVLGCSALALFGAADAFQQYDPAFPLRVVLVLACAAHSIAGVVTVFIGRAERPGYGFFMPFRGGAQFVTMQAIAYASGATALAGPSVYLRVVQPYLGVTHGLLALCGGLSAISNFMLLRSISFFDARKSLRGKPDEEGGPRSAVGEVVLVFILSALLAIMSVTAEYVEGLRRVAALVTIALYFCTGILIHVVVGWMLTPNYRLFSPLQGSFRQRFVRAAAWFFWSVAAIAGLGMAQHPGLFPRSHLIYGAVAISTNLGLLAHTRTAPRSEIRSRSLIARDGRFVLTLLAIFCTTVVMTATALQDTHFKKALSSMAIIVTVAMFTAPPLTQLTGWMAHGDAYDLWRPFHNSGSVFLTFQALGWGCLTVAFVAAAFEWPRGESLITATLLLLSQFCIHSSVRAFQAPQTPISSPDTPTKASKPEERYLRADFLAAVAVSLLSVTLRFSCDLVGMESQDFPVPFVLLVSSVLWMIAVPLCHAARKERNAAMFRPFVGTSEYVALQAIGWSCYAVCCILALVVTVEVTTNPDAMRRRFLLHRFVYTAQGLVMQVPFGLIAASLYFVDDTGDALRRLALHEVTAKFSTADFEAFANIDCSAFPIEARKLLLHVSNIHRERTIKGGGPHRDDSLRGPTTIIVSFAAVACVGFAGFADLMKSTSPVHSIVFLVISSIISVATSTAVHCGYGPSVYGSVYKRWMPFRGGASFVAWQVCAGASLGVGIILVLITALSLSSVDEPSNVSGILAAGICNGVSTLLTLTSIFYFDRCVAQQAVAKPTFFEAHAEGIVSLLVLCATWLFTSAYGLVGGIGTTNDNWALAVAPLLLGGASLMIALPLAVISFKSSARSWLQSQGGDIEEAENGTPRAATPLVVLEMICVALGCVLPALALVAAHFTYHRFSDHLGTVVRSSNLILAFMIAVTAIAIAARVHVLALPTVAIDVISAMLSFAIYCTMFTAIVSVYVAVVVVRTAGSFVFAGNVIACMSPTPVRKLGLFLTLGYVALSAYENMFALNAPEVDPLVLASDMVFALVCVLYHQSYGLGSEESGSRYSKATHAWFRENVFWGLERYFSLRIVADDPSQKSAGLASEGGRQVIYGYHPHGMFPITSVWMQATHQWTTAVGSTRRSVVHAASILFQMPMVRDLCMALGGRVVTKKAIEMTIQEGLSPMIVPGGQAEMLHTSFSRTLVKVVTHHQGFIRLAIQHRLALVPVFAFGEHNIMDNVHLPRIQRYFLDRFGFGFPVIPWGRWYLALPVATPLTAVVGRVVDPAVICPDIDTAPLDEVVEKVTNAYFAELQRIVRKHNADAGYPGFDIEFVAKAKRSHSKRA